MTGQEIMQAMRLCLNKEGDCRTCNLLNVDQCVKHLVRAATDLIERLTAENAALREGASLGKLKRSQKQAYEKQLKSLQALADRQSSEIKKLQDDLRWKTLLAESALDAQERAEKAATESDALREKVPQWIDVKDSLPKAHDNYGWEYCIVTVLESISSPFEEVDERKFVSTALFDAEQKIWHIGVYGDATLTLNALIGIEDDPLKRYCVTHWMPLPEAPEEGEKA